ncbi:ADP-ribosylation factor-like protein 15 [Acipenser ruthenus]|uniref:ADP-ribosylation factor-like protein 15 n=1 Tax=Acipenser ruthenus TaxID=7906 RepID=A0A444V3U6_ACIRT|nr:ADP-ribosylation factor-like protein 15 [Acipenser ruthenus]
MVGCCSAAIASRGSAAAVASRGSAAAIWARCSPPCFVAWGPMLRFVWDHCRLRFAWGRCRMRFAWGRCRLRFTWGHCRLRFAWGRCRLRFTWALPIVVMGYLMCKVFKSQQASVHCVVHMSSYSPNAISCGFIVDLMSLQLILATTAIFHNIKKYFELEPLARGKRWILQPSSLENMEAVRESFIQLIGQLEEKDLEPGRV